MVEFCVNFISFYGANFYDVEANGSKQSKQDNGVHSIISAN